MGAKDEQLQHFLDTQQYTRKGILLYERIFGRTFVSTGGKATTERFANEHLMDLKEDAKVLDIGCGTGGSAFYFAQRFRTLVYAIDLSINMLDIANEYRDEVSAGVSHRVQFHVEDATLMRYPTSFYDLVYSRDTILHISDKESLFKDLYRTLKPGGKLLITDYCRGQENEQDASDEFKAYVKQRGYRLLTVKEYGSTLETAGFGPGNVLAIDSTSDFISILEGEIEKFKSMKDEVIRDYSQGDYDYIINGWQQKVVRCKAGDQAWGLFVATKVFD